MNVTERHSFNPLDRGISIRTTNQVDETIVTLVCFNPLDRGISIRTEP